MITFKHGTTTYTLPRGLDRATHSAVEYAVAAYGFLLNDEGRRGVAHTWAQFSELIRAGFAQSPRRDAVLSALAAV
ncbi:MAG: hypothetical protein ACJ74Q_15135 [Pyrinomonadaceae bacterium]